MNESLPAAAVIFGWRVRKHEANGTRYRNDRFVNGVLESSLGVIAA